MVLFYGLFEAEESFDNRNEECESLATASHCLGEKSLAAHAQIRARITSTTTSLWPMNRGIVLACTGVIRVKPIVETASRIHSESEGVSASQALEVPFGGPDFDSGAMIIGV